MAGNIWGKQFRVATCGESHGPVIAAMIDGCPAGVELSTADIQKELDRRRPGQSQITTPRNESDKVEILSGVFEGKTLGTPILLLVRNSDIQSADYENLKNLYRPSHADFTYAEKYGIRDWRGGGRASARESVARVAAGAVAKKILFENDGIEIVAYVESVKDIKADINPATVRQADVEMNLMRCPNQQQAQEMIRLIEDVQQKGDSVGGVIGCVIRNVPSGLGEPVFDKLHADLAKAMLSINAVKGFEIGSGFAGTRMLGSEHNDLFYLDSNTQSVCTRSNNSGGVQGGISNGMPINFKVAFKPVPTIAMAQETLSTEFESVTMQAAGRHDSCVLPRAVPIVEAMAALVLVDHLLISKK